MKLGQKYLITFTFIGISALDKSSFVMAQTPIEKTIEHSDRFIAEKITQVRQLQDIFPNRLSDNLAITPGIVWITAPSNNNQEDDLVIGAIRTTFSF